MDRPQSIIWFERLYLGGVAVGLANTVFNWSSIQEQVAATPNSEMLPSWFMSATIAIGIGINLLLWYFVAMRGSVVAKWIVVVFFVLGLLGVVQTMVSGATTGSSTIIGSVVLALQAGAVFMLFRPDTKSWFGGGAAA